MTSLTGPMPWVFAIMVALTVIAAAAGLALSNMVNSAADALSGGATVQVVEANAAERDRQAREAARVIQAMPGVAEVHLVSQDEIQRLTDDAGGGEGIAAAHEAQRLAHRLAEAGREYRHERVLEVRDAGPGGRGGVAALQDGAFCASQQEK